MKIIFTPQDLWIGLYWKTEQEVKRCEHWDCPDFHTYRNRTYFLCFIPCLPIIWRRRKLINLDAVEQGK